MRRGERLLERADLVLPECSGFRGVALKICHRHGAEDFDLAPEFGERGGRDEAVAAIAAGAAQDLDLAFRPVRVDELGHRLAGALHEDETVGARSDHRLLSGAHFLRCKNRSAHGGGS